MREGIIYHYKKNSHSISAYKGGYTSFFLLIANVLACAAVIWIIAFGHITLQKFVSGFIVFSSLVLSAHGIFTLFWMLYAWEDPERVEKNKAPEHYRPPVFSFSVIIPARNEEAVIADTIQAMAQIAYPEELKEILIVCRFDDDKTITKAKETISKLGKGNIKLIIFSDLPVNKPHGLNIGLHFATKDIVAIFDAEDEPNKNIFQIINTVMQVEKADVVQAAVQLMNFQSTWFSTLNVLEYFFWFKSTLHFFTRCGLTPLGGNTVFFKKAWVRSIGGWDESCLTEDADIGLRLSSSGAKIRVVYDEAYATTEETPLDIDTFIRQRTRWNQGFLQILLKGDWLRLPHFFQRLLIFYILIWPEIQALLFIYIPISILMILRMKVFVGIAILSAVPIYLQLLQYIIYTIGLYEFCRGYNVKYPITAPLRILSSFFPYQFLLGVSALRAVWRAMIRNNVWEKTMHANAHRKMALS